MNSPHIALRIFFIGFVTMVVACDDGGRTRSQQRRPRAPRLAEWYEGGTLHDKTIAEWNAATIENRLATCADFVMVLGKYQTLPPDLKQRAMDFDICISKATEDGIVDDKSVSEIAAVCAVSLGY